jgi:hypothetical protein
MTATGQIRDSGAAHLGHHKQRRHRENDMSTTTIRTTCGSCQLTADIPTANVILVLPSPCSDTTVTPSFWHVCAACRTCRNTSVPWRAATYLLDAGATAIASPDVDRMRPQYPERRPPCSSPMTLDDLLDLHAALDSDAGAL